MKDKLVKHNDYEWILPTSARKEMKVEGKLIANKSIYDSMEDETISQLSNVCCLPGVVGPVIALPDAHIGYGLPMGAVAAFDAEEGLISSGLCGFDINCGINTIRTNLSIEEVRKKISVLIPELFKAVPCGVGSKGRLRLTNSQLDEVLTRGINWAVENNYGVKEDIAHMEEHGCMEGGDSSKVSDLAKDRGRSQLGTLGAGNHFLEIQSVAEIFDQKTAKKYGIVDMNQVLIMLHCGSRGLGHQVATDYLKIQEEAVKRYNIWLPDKQLECAPVHSKEGQDYFSAMKCAVNYSFTNRLVMTQWIRETFARVFERKWEDMDMQTLYGLCHNVVKLEEHKVDGKKRKLYVHRKGATRSFPGDIALIAGSMGTSSYILEGTQKAMDITFGSSCHGAGRALSRNAAIARFKGETIKSDLAKLGILAKSTSPIVLAEEAPDAYKDVSEVIDSVHSAGISRKIVRLNPLGVLKG
ncbi:MAG: RtcB family protein [Candidatus Woesearchaeota archaeon]